MGGEVFAELRGCSIVQTLQVNVDVTNDVDRLNERRQTIKDVRHVSEERSGRVNRSGTVHNGDDTRQRARNDANA
jgi:hypothetical protein